MTTTAMFPVVLYDVDGRTLNIADIAKERCLIVLGFHAVDDLGVNLLRHLAEFSGEVTDRAEKREVRKILIQEDVTFLVAIGGEERRVRRIKKSLHSSFLFVHDADLQLAHTFPAPTAQNAPVLYEVQRDLTLGEFLLTGDKMHAALTALQLYLLKRRIDAEDLAFRALRWARLVGGDLLQDEAVESKVSLLEPDALEPEAGRVPTDVLFQIFGFMEPRERRSARLVCKTWHSSLMNLLRKQLAERVKEVENALPQAAQPKGSRSTRVQGPSRELIVRNSFQQLLNTARALIVFLYISGGSDGISADAANLVWQARQKIATALTVQDTDSALARLLRFEDEPNSQGKKPNFNFPLQHLTAAAALLSATGFFPIMREEMRSVSVSEGLKQHVRRSLLRQQCLLVSIWQFLSAIQYYLGKYSEAAEYASLVLELDQENTAALILHAHACLPSRKTRDAEADLKRVDELITRSCDSKILDLLSPTLCPCLLEDIPCPFMNAAHFASYSHEPPPGLRLSWEQSALQNAQRALDTAKNSNRAKLSRLSGFARRRHRHFQS
eukprot:gb/GEZN01004516.1/.p1 GENE.gb/GEZN01004516.1/~~gb/GEZN01004516.1/.p1  ORF type:complete len:564 (+),score=70.71 gb/GEZN01004516.1/:28-1692(+)